uniref:Uncharacterized protein n=1 Tax=Meloidogyne enterolobii TaxID=390850 RepID=A0A6V7UGA6_MELEN|nr:unnamed protein product [Meloidogyne enterolobii]
MSRLRRSIFLWMNISLIKLNVEERNLFNVGEEASNQEKVESCVDDQNQIVVEEQNKICENYINQINLNELPFDLNKEPCEEE